jgi:hypothetical protein
MYLIIHNSTEKYMDFIVHVPQLNQLFGWQSTQISFNCYTHYKSIIQLLILKVEKLVLYKYLVPINQKPELNDKIF